MWSHFLNIKRNNLTTLVLGFASSYVLLIDICTHRVVISIVHLGMHGTFYESLVTQSQISPRHVFSLIHSFMFLEHFMIMVYLKAKIDSKCNKLECGKSSCDIVTWISDLFLKCWVWLAPEPFMYIIHFEDQRNDNPDKCVKEWYEWRAPVGMDQGVWVSKGEKFLAAWSLIGSSQRLSMPQKGTH